MFLDPILGWFSNDLAIDLGAAGLSPFHRTVLENIRYAKPDATEEEIDALNGQLETVIKQSGGKVDKTDKWGTRKLAYLN